ncbi:MAG: putative bifunctional diguanylate cyclase/phosphodiesterase [Thermoleophilaceae bacterium]
MPAGNWSIQQLTEFLAALSSVRDPASATREAVERAAEALEAEVGAVIRHGFVVASVGFPAGRAPQGALLAAAESGEDVVELDGLGRCAALTIALDEGCIFLARVGDERFSREDVSVARGMSRVLTLSLKLLQLVEDERGARRETERTAKVNMRLLESVEERGRLLDQLAKIQRSISHRTRLDDVLGAIVEGASGLIDADGCSLWLLDTNDPDWLINAGATGTKNLQLPGRVPVSHGMAGLAISRAELTAIDDYAASDGANPDLVKRGVATAVGVPVHEHGTVVGALVVASYNPERRFTTREKEMLVSYAEHASLALAAARTVDTMRQAFNDPLTGLANRALLLDRLEHALARAKRNGTEVSIIFLDLDRFKLVNDSLGHAAGDELLVAVAERVHGSLRQAETAARLGGDEFAVLLEGETSASDAVRVARRIDDALRAPFTLHDREVTVTASIGIASGDGSAQDLLRDADVAMYRAKARGRGRYEVFEPGMHAEILQRLELEADIQRALDRDEFVLHYQPIVELGSERIVGLEALVRWMHPQRGLVPPGDFIAISEETGLVLPIGAWVLREACRQAAVWQAEIPLEAPLTISVNLSGRQLQQPTLAGEVREALGESRLAPGTLMLELTETVLMQDSEGAVAQLRELKELDILVAVDDFGTGYSSLRYLKSFPIDVLKVAKPFVDELANPEERGVLARAIVELSRNLGLGSIAEGIESSEQAARLRELGCAYGQGFLFARPLDAAAVTALLAAGSVTGGFPLAAPALRGFEVR